MKESALKKVKEKGKTIAKDMIEHLHASKSKMFSWNPNEIPEISLWNTIDVTTIIGRKIENEIIAWSIQNKDNINSEMGNILKKEFMILEEDLGIEKGQFGSIDECQSQCENRAMALCATLGFSTPVSYSLIGGAIITGLLFPDIIVLPMLFLKDVFYRRNKMQIMALFAKNILENYVTENYTNKRITPFLTHILDRVKYICDSVVPRKIKAYKMVIELASKERLSVKDIMRKYRPNQIRCEMLLGKIDIILMEYFPESKGSFQYIYNSKIVNEIGRGAFSYVQSAVVSINFEDTLVAVKTLTSPLDGMYSYTQLSEARILR